MKKALMLVAAIALLAAPVFAEVEVTISGEATTSFGYNLDTEVYGMLSEVSSDVELAIGALDGESMGEGAWYGVITLEGAALSFGDGYGDGDMIIPVIEYDEDLTEATSPLSYQKMVLTAPDVTAKITDGNIYVQLQSEADFDADYVAGVDNDPFEFADPATAGSLTIGGTFAPVTFGVEFGMAGSYEDAAQVDGVALGANIELDLAPLTVKAAYAGGYGYATDQETGIALEVKADVAPVTVVAAFDGQILSGDFTYEAGLDVDFEIDVLTAGLDVRYAEDDLDTKVTVGYASDMLTADAFLGLYDLTTTIVWETGVDVTVKPASGIEFNAGWAYASTEVMSAYADVAFTELVDNVTFKLGWEDADDLLGNDATETDMGQIYVSAGIAY